MDKVVVLLSSYNGEKYIREQIDSILKQKNVKVELIVRDDGSTDNTIKILNQYSKEYPNFRYYQGKNLGPAFSFLELISNAPNANFYSLADQDDVWDNDKLYIGISTLKKIKTKIPLLYHCNTRIVDKDLHTLRIGKKNINKTSKYSALMENRATGCTMIFNDIAREKIISRSPEYVSMHDSWIYLIVSFFGKVIYDNKAHMSYRQHNNNVIGANTCKVDKIKSKINRLFDFNSMPRYRLANSFLSMYGGELSKEEYKKAKKLVNYKNSIKDKLYLIIDKDFKSDSILRNIEYTLLIVLGNL